MILSIQLSYIVYSTPDKVIRIYQGKNEEKWESKEVS